MMRTDNDHVVGNSVDRCEDESKPLRLPEEDWEDGKLKILENDNNSVCKLLFYDTRSGDKREKRNALVCYTCGYCDETEKVDFPEKVDPVFYIDKSDLLSVKDICVDGNNKVDDFEFGNDLQMQRDMEESSRKEFTDAEDSSSCSEDDLIVDNEEVEESPTYILRGTSFEIRPEGNSKEDLIEDFSFTLGDIFSRQDQPKLLNNDNSNRPQEQQSLCQLQDEEKRRLETEQNGSYISTTISYRDDKRLASSVGETSFSAAEPVQGHITYSGPITFSGSLSVRSDASSTTSGQSFAFPVLQSEWNSSPVRMAKADKRRRKGWRQILLRCRFF